MCCDSFMSFFSGNHQVLKLSNLQQQQQQKDFSKHDF